MSKISIEIGNKIRQFRQSRKMTLDELAPAIHKSRTTLSKCSRQLFPVPVKENLPDSIQITPEGMLKVVRQMNPDQRRKFTRLLFA